MKTQLTLPVLAEISEAEVFMRRSTERRDKLVKTNSYYKKYDKPPGLSGLAQFLADNLISFTNRRGHVKLYVCTETTADRLRRAAKNSCYVNGSKLFGENAQQRAIDETEDIIKRFDLENELFQISDHEFPKFDENGTSEYETVADYLEFIAREIEETAISVKIIDGYNNIKTYQTEHKNN